MSLAQPEATSKPKSSRTTYETVKQGIKQLYPPESSTNSTNIDVVFVPGLGANPEESWKSTKGDFNWALDKHGLPKDYPNARVLLYMYESAFHGPLKVDQFMDNIAKGLLHALQSKRDKEFNRPLVFIGHSMGGLVIAKAVTIMDTQRDTFRKMFEATAGCVFFGSPFNGAQAASVAAMFSVVGERFGQATTSKLLDLMKPGDASLRELRGDFMRLVTKLSPKIELYCFWENHDTDMAKMASEFIAKRDPTGGRVSGAFYDLFKRAAGPIKIVDRESATFGDVVDNLGLACNHRDLVKFEDFKDPRYQLIRDPLKKIIHGAPLVAKNRLNSTRDVDLDAIKNITEALEGSGISRKRIAQKFSPSSWLPTDGEFEGWLAKDVDPHEAAKEIDPKDAARKKRGDCLWICGAEGRGKTGATIAALEEIEKAIKSDEHNDSGKAPIILAYYFCDPTSDGSVTAEDVLKSLLLQLIQKQPYFVSYAKQFTRRDKRQPVPTSVENLWQSLQDMLSDDTASSRIYFVVNNLHGLPPDSDSTKKLLDLIKADMSAMNDEEVNRISTRWMFTSRKSNKMISDIASLPSVRLIDLEDEKYADQVQLELRKHAAKKVAMLGSEKKYKKDLAYFVSSLIGNRAQNTGWIDITCSQLEELPESENPLRVRQTLKKLPQHLDDLLSEGWKQIFDANVETAEKIKDMLQALVLTYEDPTLVELAVLAGFQADDEGTEELRDLVGRCKSFLVIKGGKVCFKSPIVKPHLLRHAKALMNVSEEEVKWLHGELALRSFTHLMERFDGPETEKEKSARTEGAASVKDEGDGEQEGAENEEEGENEDAEQEQQEEEQEQEEQEQEEGEEEEQEDDDEENTDDDDSDNDGDDAEEEPEITALPYMVEHWLHHASKSTAEMAENLSLEESFWKPDSLLRRRWLTQYEYLTKAYDELDHTSLSALHVAASVGFRQLVTALMKNGYENELNLLDSLANTPLHLAAFFGRPNIVEELIYRGAQVDGGKDEEDATPLFMAASKGAIKVMNMLLTAGADPNAIDSDHGRPLNAAIDSGNLDAVKLLIEKGAEISPAPDSRFQSPLSCAARLPDSSTFDFIMDAGKDVLTTLDRDDAFVSAADAGNVEVFRKLLEYEHRDEIFQEALERATEECEWEIVRILLDQFSDLDCDELFEAVATGYDDQDELLDVIWKYTDGGISKETLSRSLYQATDNEKESTVKYLLEECKADPNATGDEFGNALTAAAYDGTLDMVKMLLNAGADINSPDGWALQAAAGEGHEEVVSELIARGADVNALTGNENFPQGSALQAACEAGKVDIVRLLLSHKADANLGSGELTCPLIAAARKGEGDILELLVEHGAKVDVFGGPDNTTPLINAAINLPKRYIKVLVDADADINLADHDGDTALIMAAMYQDDESVEFLLESGADVKAVSHLRGQNALQAAFHSGSQRCLELLIEHVSKILSGEPVGKSEEDQVPEGGSEAAEQEEEVAEEENEAEKEEDETLKDGEEPTKDEEEDTADSIKDPRNEYSIPEGVHGSGTQDMRPEGSPSGPYQAEQPKVTVNQYPDERYETRHRSPPSQQYPNSGAYSVTRQPSGVDYSGSTYTGDDYAGTDKYPVAAQYPPSANSHYPTNTQYSANNRASTDNADRTYSRSPSYGQPATQQSPSYNESTAYQPATHAQPSRPSPSAAYTAYPPPITRSPAVSRKPVGSPYQGGSGFPSHTSSPAQVPSPPNSQSGTYAPPAPVPTPYNRTASYTHLQSTMYDRTPPPPQTYDQASGNSYNGYAPNHQYPPNGSTGYQTNNQRSPGEGYPVNNQRAGRQEYGADGEGRYAGAPSAERAPSYGSQGGYYGSSGGRT